jgi:hypothetical protein
MLLQPFINYNMKKVRYLTRAPIITANWNVQGDAADGNDTTGGRVWTLPFGGSAGRIMGLGYQAGQPFGELLWQRWASYRGIALGHAASDCAALPQKAKSLIIEFVCQRRSTYARSIEKHSDLLSTVTVAGTIFCSTPRASSKYTTAGETNWSTASTISQPSR